VPDPELAFSFNELCVEAAVKDDRIQAALWVSPKPSDEDMTAEALTLAGEPGVAGPEAEFPAGRPGGRSVLRPVLDRIFASAREHGLVVHVHTSPGAASDIDEIGQLVDWYADDVRCTSSTSAAG